MQPKSNRILVTDQTLTFNYSGTDLTSTTIPETGTVTY
jgi:hypothetical protein